MQKQTESASKKENLFPPVVAVLGHVDHGKTTLLDAIRKTGIAQKEAGGITQKIGASSIEIIHEGKKRGITFIDTPGHEAFSQMRDRGADAADIALLVIASTEGLKPQTKESIDILKSTKTRFIVVLTKSDMPNKITDKVKQELLREQITLEEFGGDIPAIEVSAKTNLNIKELTDLILLVFDFNKSDEYQKEISADARLQAIVIESKLDPKAGPKATIIIKNGTIRLRDEIAAETTTAKIRTIINDKGVHLKEATVGEAVEILGFEKVPPVGSIITHKIHALAPKQPQALEVPLKRELSYQKKEEKVGISVVLIADTHGSLEAIVNALPKKIIIVLQKTGEVTEADILLAKSTDSIVLSFNTRIRNEITKLATHELVLLRNYTIIYEMLDELKDALEGKLQSQMEQIYGSAKILAKFPYEKTTAYGIQVTEGRIAKNDKVRFLRGKENVLGESAISSLRIGKNPTSKVEKGHEAGILITSPLDILPGDVIISHS